MIIHYHSSHLSSTYLGSHKLIIGGTVSLIPVVTNKKNKSSIWDHFQWLKDSYN